MSLYIRVDTSFWSHRKTMRLVSKIGNDGFWLPIRLWSYAATNQPDGCFKDYNPQEMALLVGYAGDAQAMLEALLQAGFLLDDPIRINDWASHNGYHKKFSQRASRAAKARWNAERRRQEKIGVEKRREEPSIACSMLEASSVYEAYPRKVGKKDALKAIQAASKAVPVSKLLAMAESYAKAVADVRKEDRKYIPHPATWFNAGRYDDDPQEWSRIGNGTPTLPMDQPI